MARGYIAGLLALTLTAGCSATLQHTEPDILNIKPIPYKRVIKKRPKIAKVYWDAYADEEYQRPTRKCPKWKPCLTKLLNSTETIIRKEVRQSRRFRRHYHDVDFVLMNVGKWKSPDNGLQGYKALRVWAIARNYYKVRASWLLWQFKDRKPIKFREVDLRLGFTGQFILSAGYADEIPGRYLLVQKGKRNLETTVHELGHLLGLYHNDEQGNVMHHVDTHKYLRFSNAGRALIADRIMSMVHVRNLEVRMKKDKDRLEEASKSLERIVKSPSTFDKSTDNQCLIEKREDKQKREYMIAINPSGSLNVEFRYRGKKPELHAKKHVKKFKDFFNYLKSLGISSGKEEVVYYNTKWGDKKKKSTIIINVEAIAFQQNFDNIIGYLFRQGFLKSDKKAYALKMMNYTAFRNNLHLFDFLYYYSEKRINLYHL